MSQFLALFDLIGELARRRHQSADRHFAPIGLNHTEARLLTLLQKDGGAANQDSLSKRLSVDRSNGVRALQRLQEDGYVLRKTDEGDKRAKQVEITAKGRKAVIEIAKIRRKIAESFFGDLQEHEAAQIVELLSRSPEGH